MTQTQGLCYHIFYTKDIHKKKKVFREGVLHISINKMGKIYDEDGHLVTSFKSKQQVDLEQEYTINNSYLMTIDKIGNISQFNNGSIFTKKDLIILPIKKKFAKPLETKSKEEDLVKFESGLYVQRKLYQILRPHQIQGVNFMYKCVSGKQNSALFGCILADFMGLGKTLQTIALAYSMVKQKDIKKFIIVCPLTLLDVWQKQTKKWLQEKITPLVCNGDGNETTKTVSNFASYEYRMLIISYETFYKNMEKLSGKSDLIIFDEGHRMKNKKSKLLLKLRTFKCDKRILLTGTPIQNNLQELYTCISIINPRLFGNQTLFKNVFQKPILEGLAKKATPQQKKLANQRTSQLAKQLKEFSLRRTADILKKFLPPKNEHIIFLKLNELQHMWYERIVKSSKQNKCDVFKTLNQLRKLFIDPKILKMKKMKNGEFDCFQEDCNESLSNKLSFTLEMIQQCVSNNEKVVVVSYYTETLDFIGSLLKNIGISCAKLDGRLTCQQRKTAILKFQGSTPVLLLSGKAGGTGLTLICATKMIMIEPEWNPSHDSQVMGRVWRQGQTAEVHIYRLVIASSFEEKMLQRQSLKKTLANNLIDDGKENGENNGVGVDFENLGKLFVQNKGEVLTYKNKEDQIKEFLELHPNLIKNLKADNGIIFVKTNRTANEDIKQQQQNRTKTSNEFDEMTLEMFDQSKANEGNPKNKNHNEDQNLDAEESEEIDQSDQESSNQFQQLYQINPKKLNAQKSLNTENSWQEVQSQKNCTQQNVDADKGDSETQTQGESQTKLSSRKQNTQKQYDKSENEAEQTQILTKKYEKKQDSDEQQESILITKKNMKTETTIVGPRNLLKKIMKK